MSGFYIPLSGLKANTTALNTIANNLSNMSTTGYKTQTTNFSSLFYQEMGTNGAGNSIQVGTGVQVASNSTDFANGAISSTDVASDAAIDGSGFFVLDANGGQVLTRNGTFQVSNTGALESTDGYSVMGYTATNGTINTNAGVSDLTIPVGAVMQPSATTSFSMTQNLNASAAVGTSTTGQVKVYDSLGNSYEATVTYKKTGTNTWSYNVTLPDTVTQNSSNSTPAVTYTLSSQYSTVDPSTSLVIKGQDSSGSTVSISAPTVTSGETLAQYAAALNAAISTAGITGVSVTSTTSGTLAIVGNNVTTSGSLVEDPVTAVANSSSSSDTYTYGLNSSSDNVNANTTLTINGYDASGNAVTAAVTMSADQSLSSYASALSSAISASGMQNVSASQSNGTLTITGSSFTVTGSLYDDKAAASLSSGSSTNYDYQYAFGKDGNGTLETVNTGTNLTITGTNASGVATTITAPTITSGETVAEYTTALQTALTNAGIEGVSISESSDGAISITGVGVTVTGSVIGDPVASSNTSGTLNFDSSGNLASPAGNISGVTFAGLSSGAAKLNATWDLFNSTGSSYISQTTASSSTSATTQNGYASGEYQSYSIDTSGVIKAQYSNGESQKVGQIAIATVTNEEGLKLMGSSNFEATSKSGDASIGIAGEGGRGTIQGSALEASNVNVSDQFSQLIVAQRAFEASSKAITAFNTVSEDVIALIR